MAEGNVTPRVWVTVTVLVAVIGGICIIIAAVIGIWPDIVEPETPTALALQATSTVTATNAPSTPASATSPPETVATDTPSVSATATPLPQPTPDLWQFYVDDIKKSVPNASVTVETLKDIAAKIPANVSYFAEAEVGLIPYQYNGNIIDRAGPVSLNTPEGGYAYISWGNGRIKTNEVSIDYQWEEGNAYLVLVIGKPDDGTPTDLNTPLELSDFSSGNVYTNFAFPAPGQVFRGPIINKAWFSQQLWWAQRNSSITVSIVDLQTGDHFDYNVDPASLTWSAR